MKKIRKMQVITMILALALLAPLIPAKPVAATTPTLIPSIEIQIGSSVFVTLTNVYEYYVPQGSRMSIFMAQDGTIKFDGSFSGTNAPYVGHPYSFAGLSTDGSAVSINIGWCGVTSSYVFPDYMELVGGTYTWVAQLMLNAYATHQDHLAALEIEGRRSLHMHVSPNVYPPNLPSITIRPPDIFEDDNLTITFTHVYDAIGRADIATQSAIWFYLAPEGSISFNRAIDLISMDTSTGEYEEIHLPAGQVLNVAGHRSLSFHYGDFEVHDHHYATSRALGFLFNIRSDGDHPINLPTYEKYTVSFHKTLSQQPGAARTLRFVIGSTTFTDNNASRTLEAAPFIAHDRTMVPLRVISEALGATNINFVNGVITFNLAGQNFTMTIGLPLPNNMGVPVIVEDRTFVPLAFIATEMGAQVNWNQATRAAYVYITNVQAQNEEMVDHHKVTKSLAGTWDWPGASGNPVYIYDDGTWSHSSGDVGVYGNISITESDGDFLLVFIVTRAEGPGAYGSPGIPPGHGARYGDIWWDNGVYSLATDELSFENWDGSTLLMERRG